MFLLPLGPIFTLPGSQTQGELFSVSCVGNICTIVGVSFNNTSTNNLPLVYTSNDGGSNWTLSPDLTLPSGATEGFLLGIDCRSNSCAAIGTSDNGSANSSQPLAYTSNDGGINWTASSPFILPGSQTQGELFGITCVGNNCTAVE